MPKVFYTDGGCHNESGNLKGIGSWAFVEYDEDSDEVIIYARKVLDTTNNRTEMLAIINAILSCDIGTEVHIISDSGYVVKGYTHPSYLDKWISTGWRTSNNKPVSNIDLWQKILVLSYHYNLKFTLVRGHMKDKNPIHAYWNSLVDRACTIMMDIDYTGTVKIIYNKYDKTFKIKMEVIDNGEEPCISDGC